MDPTCVTTPTKDIMSRNGVEHVVESSIFTSRNQFSHPFSCKLSYIACRAVMYRCRTQTKRNSKTGILILLNVVHVFKINRLLNSDSPRFSHTYRSQEPVSQICTPF